MSDILEKEKQDPSLKQIYNDEITIGELMVKIRNWIRLLWSRKRVIISITVITVVLGLIIEYGSGTEFEAENAVITYTRSSVPGLSGNVGGLAALAVVSPAELAAISGGGRIVTETMLPVLIATYPVGSRLADQPLQFYSHETDLTSFEYFTQYYTEPPIPRFFNRLFGFPRSVLSFLRPSRTPAPQTAQAVSPLSEETGDADEMGYDAEILPQRAPLFVPRSGMLSVIAHLANRIEFEERNGLLLIRARMPDAYAAADLARVATEQLMNELIRFEIRKTEDQLQFLEEEYELSRERFEYSQLALAEFLDRNQGNLSATARIQEQRLQNDLDLAFSIYSNWTRQVENTRVQLREDTPIYTVVDPVRVPSRPASPDPVSALLLSLFLGLFWGVGYVTLSALYHFYKPSDF